MLKIYVLGLAPALILYNLIQFSSTLTTMSYTEDNYCTPDVCYYTLSFAKFESVFGLLLSVMWVVVRTLEVIIFFDINILNCRASGARQDEGNRGVFEEVL